MCCRVLSVTLVFCDRPCDTLRSRVLIVKLVFCLLPCDVLPSSHREVSVLSSSL